MNKTRLKKLFGPRALAATVGTAMLLHAAVAWATNCYSEAVYTSPQCTIYCSAYVTDANQPGCSVHYLNQYVYWCCPTGTGCGLLDGSQTQCWGWCTC
jgi:hypothetical protein